MYSIAEVTEPLECNTAQNVVYVGEFVIQNLCVCFENIKCFAIFVTTWVSALSQTIDSTKPYILYIYIYIPAQHSNLAHCTAARANLPQYFVLPLHTACHGPEEHI